MSVDPQDFINRRLVSECCGAPLLEPDFCSECREHATLVPEDETEDDLAARDRASAKACGMPEPGSDSARELGAWYDRMDTRGGYTGD